MQYVAVFCNTMQLITIKLCTKFQNPKSNSCWEIFDRKNVHMYYMGVREEKIENLNKEGKMRTGILIFIYTIHFACLKVTQNLKTLALIGAEKYVTEIFIGEKEKMNK